MLVWSSIANWFYAIRRHSLGSGLYVRARHTEALPWTGGPLFLIVANKQVQNATGYRPSQARSNEPGPEPRPHPPVVTDMISAASSTTPGCGDPANNDRCWDRILKKHQGVPAGMARHDAILEVCLLWCMLCMNVD